MGQNRKKVLSQILQRILFYKKVNVSPQLEKKKYYLSLQCMENVWTCNKTCPHIFPLPVHCYLPVTEQNVRTVHLESGRQMERSLCWNTNLLTAWEFRSPAQNAWRATKKKQKKTKLHITTVVVVPNVRCIYVEEASRVIDLKTAEDILNVFIFLLNYQTQRIRKQRREGVICCGCTQTACHIGSQKRVGLFFF